MAGVGLAGEGDPFAVGDQPARGRGRDGGDLGEVRALVGVVPWDGPRCRY